MYIFKGRLHFCGHFCFGRCLPFWVSLIFLASLNILKELTSIAFYSMEIQLEIPEIAKGGTGTQGGQHFFLARGGGGIPFFSCDSRAQNPSARSETQT